MAKNRIIGFFHSGEAIKRNADDEIVKKISESVDINSSDDAGLDPFKLRKVQPTGNPNISIETLLSTFNIASTPSNATLVVDRQNNGIPKVAHFIWEGSSFARPDTRSVVESWRRSNPDMPIILWTDQTKVDDVGPKTQEVADMVDWCKQNNVALVNVDSVFKGHMENEAFYLLEYQRRKYGAATDILRLDILDRFGGIYSDIDIFCNQPVDLKNRNGVLIDGARRFYKETEVNSIMNDLICFAPGHADIKELKKSIRDNYLKNYSQLFDKCQVLMDDMYRRNYDQNVFALSPACVVRESTIVRTGPGVYVNYYGSREYETIKCEGFQFNSFETWMASNTTKGSFTAEERIEQIKLVLTAILRDLKDEPRMLRLDAYAKTLLKYDITNIVLQTLVAKFPEQLKHVKQAQFLNACDNSKAISLIVDNKKVFPNLVLDKDNLLSRYTTMPNAGALKFLLDKKYISLSNLDAPYMVTKFDIKSNPIIRMDKFMSDYKEAIKLGVNVNVVDRRQTSPLSMVCENINTEHALECMEFLLKEMDSNLINNKVKNPLVSLIRRGGSPNEISENQLLGIDLLLNNKKVDINVVTNIVGTPLHAAIMMQRPALVNILLKKGAKVDIPFNGQTAVQLITAEIEHFRRLEQRPGVSEELRRFYTDSITQWQDILTNIEKEYKHGKSAKM